jgi:hypothetical protein
MPVCPAANALSFGIALILHNGWAPRSSADTPIDTCRAQSHRRAPPARHVNQLERRVLEAIDRVPQQTIESLYLSMEERIDAVIEAKGGNIGY